MAPDQRIVTEHLQTPEFRSGVADGIWGHIEVEQVPWPHVLLWIAAPARKDAPDRFHVRLDCTGYPTDAPTGNLVDPCSWGPLDAARRPKGRTGSRFARVMRTDWEGGRAFYHPFDRRAAKSHPDWPKAMPRKLWTPAHTLTSWLEEFYALFQSDDYLGV